MKSHIKNTGFAVLTGCALTFGLGFANQPAAPVEVGQVEWRRDLDQAVNESATTGKPVLVLFQEVPGCAGCRQFGKDVLSHPPLVEAMQTEFLPVLVHNNKGGKDAEILKRFGEAAWNYQVIRFLDGKSRDIIPRKDRVWDIHGVATRMINALKSAKRPVPNYLQAIAADSQDMSKLKLAGFAMHCFWTGEMRLGRINGVLHTEAGWLDGREIALVRYDPKVLSFRQLTGEAAKIDCAHKVYTSSLEELAELKRTGRFAIGQLDDRYQAASKSDQKKQLQGTPFAKLDLSPLQRTKVNAWARTDIRKALAWLSSSQRAQLGSADN